MFEKKMKINLTIFEFLGLVKDYRNITNPSLLERLPIYKERNPRLYLTDYMSGSVYTSVLCYIALELNFGHVADMPSISTIFQTAPLGEGSFKLVDDMLESVFRLFINRNWFNYCLVHNTCEKIEDVKVQDINKQVYSLFNNILSILEMTKDKYLYLLHTYDSEKNNLLNKLQRTRNLGVADTRNVTGESKQFLNTTPQEPADNTEDYFDYVNQASKNNDTTSDVFSSTQNEYISEDRDYLIDKIDSIDKKMDLLLKRWCKELDVLIWEE